MWKWSEAIEETKDELCEFIKGIIDRPVDTLGKEDVTNDLEMRSGKPIATSASNQTFPTLEPLPADSCVNQTLHIMFKDAMARAFDSTVAQQLVDIAKNIAVLSDKEERHATSYSHHTWPPDCPDKLTRHITRGMLRMISFLRPGTETSSGRREDHLSKATIEEEKSDGNPEVLAYGSQLVDDATRTSDQARAKMHKEGDFSHHMWPNILGNEADRQLLCLPREEFPRSLPDQTPVIMPIPDK